MLDRRPPLKKSPGLLGIILVLALLAGCASEMPVSGSATTRAVSPAPTGAQTAAPVSTTPVSPSIAPAEATPVPSATAGLTGPGAYRWPLDASGLFSPGGVPDDFSSPLYVPGDGLMFLYVTDGGNIRRALWNGTGYVTHPVAENVDAGATAAAVVDGAGHRLFCPGTRRYADGKSGPAIVAIDLNDGSRCNLDEAAKLGDAGLLIASDYQYADGTLLVRLTGADGALMNQWAVFDVARQTFTVLDLTGFKAGYLQGWNELVSLTVALTGKNRALAVCVAGGYAAPEATGTEGAVKSPYECLAIPMDLTGSPAGDAVKIAGSDRNHCCSLQYGKHFRASADGKKLLYTADGGGLYVYDIAANKERAVYSGAAALTFAAWGKDGAVYYSAATEQPAGGYLIHRADISKLGKGQ